MSAFYHDLEMRPSYCVRPAYFGKSINLSQVESKNGVKWQFLASTERVGFPSNYSSIN